MSLSSFLRELNEMLDKDYEMLASYFDHELYKDSLGEEG